MREEEVLEYHASGRPGKLEVVPTKPCLTQRDLSIAYSPGVAWPVLRIAKNPEDADLYTARANLVAVVTNGTAILGLGNLGPLAAKPVMEGKAILFKRFADIDVFDLEIDATDVDTFCTAVAALEPTFGGINLEDVKSPECFVIEERLRERMRIPVFHDDQHGTAIIATAGLLNALEVQGKSAGDVRVVVCGAGAAGISCARMFVLLGVRADNLLMLDSKGVLTMERAASLPPVQREFARATSRTTLAEAMEGADVFCGVSVAGLVTPALVRSMASRPIVFALANPDPEIPYPDAIAAADGVIAATGRSDFPNQVNNVLGFPYVFRGALDVRATTVNDAMKVAAARALAALARKDVPDSVCRAYQVESLRFGPEYIIPKPLDPRVLQEVPPAVARAAVDSGVARRPITDWDAYGARLERIRGAGHAAMRRVHQEARGTLRRIAYCEGDDPRVLKAAETVLDERLAIPVLLGQPARIEALKREMGLQLDGAEIVDAMDPGLLASLAEGLHATRARRGVTPQTAKRMLRHRPVLGMTMLATGMADGLVGGLGRPYAEMLRPALEIIGAAPGVRRVAGCIAAIFPQRPLILTDVTVNTSPSPEDLCEIAWQAAQLARLFDMEPRVAFLSFSNFGDSRHPDAERPRKAAALFRERHPEIPSDGEMHPDTALNAEHALTFFPHSAVQGDANVLVVPDLDAGLIAYKLLKQLARVEIFGPLLSGMSRPVNILNYAADVDEIVHFTALTSLAARSAAAVGR